MQDHASCRMQKCRKGKPTFLPTKSIAYRDKRIFHVIVITNHT
jgi:hypothetical protein